MQVARPEAHTRRTSKEGRLPPASTAQAWAVSQGGSGRAGCRAGVWKLGRDYQPQRKAIAGRGQGMVCRQHSRRLAERVQARLQTDAAAVAAAGLAPAGTARCQQVATQLPRSVHRLCIKICEAAHQGFAAWPAAASNAAGATSARAAPETSRCHGNEQLLQRGNPAHIRCQACRAASKGGRGRLVRWTSPTCGRCCSRVGETEACQLSAATSPQSHPARHLHGNETW